MGADLVPVVTHTPTIQDGPVVRWFRSVDDAEAHRVTISASRNRVIVSAEFRTSSELTALVRAMQVASRVQGQILNGDDIHHVATHVRPRISAPFEEVRR
jgi:hypothetical protein